MAHAKSSKKNSVLHSAKNLKFGIVISRFNEGVSNGLLSHCLQTLVACGAKPKNIQVCWVPGAFEIPFAAQRVARAKKADAIICLGCIIRGQTPHFEHIAREASHGIARVALDYDLPVIFGVLTTNTEKEARDRSGRKKTLNRGHEAAMVAVEMAYLFKKS